MEAIAIAIGLESGQNNIYIVNQTNLQVPVVGVEARGRDSEPNIKFLPAFVLL